MQPEIISLKEVGDLGYAVSRSVEALRLGKIAVFPTETVYGLAALASNAEAVKRLCVEKGRRAGHALPIAISGEKALKRYAPNASATALRLARRFWPGPLTLVLDVTDPQSELQSLPDFSRRAIVPETTAGFRVPQNKFLLDVLNVVDEPLVLTSANLTGEAPAVSADEARDALGERPDFIVDDGLTSLGKPSTVAKVEEDGVTILREGAISGDRVKRGAAKAIVFVCTGNTCRSPMAEVLAKKILSKRLGISPEELDSHGYVVLSAGLAAYDFSPASVEARRVVSEEYGLSLEDHASQSFDQNLALIADVVFAMSASHQAALESLYPQLRERVFLLNADGSNISDPFGGSYETYSACAKQIEEQIRLQLPKII